jgi:hypothetical protein
MLRMRDYIVVWTFFITSLAITAIVTHLLVKLLHLPHWLYAVIYFLSFGGVFIFTRHVYSLMFNKHRYYLILLNILTLALILIGSSLLKYI